MVGNRIDRDIHHDQYTYENNHLESLYCIYTYDYGYYEGHIKKHGFCALVCIEIVPCKRYEKGEQKNE